MISLTELGLRRRRLTLLVMGLLIVLGLSVYQGFPKREDPAITVRTTLVIAANPGLSLEQLEEFVARPLEEAARAVAGVSEVRTRIADGTAVLQVDVAEAVPEERVVRVFDEIRDDMELLARRMPDGTLGPTVDTGFGDVAIATVAVSGPEYSARELERLAEDLRDVLYGLDPISAVSLDGTREERVQLEIDRDRLASIGTTIGPLVDALQGQNVRLASGSIAAGGTRVPLETSGGYTSTEDIGATLVELPGIGLVRLEDLLEVRRGYEEPSPQTVFRDGDPAVLLSIEMRAGEDIVGVGEVVRERVDAFRATAPLGIDVAFSTFQPDEVRASVDGALMNMLQTFAVVLLVMLVFLGWRQALVIAAIVPFAVAFAFLGMRLLGIELQQVSIAAIIISLGLLVDNGLVVVEDMDRRLRAGDDRMSAALGAGQQYTAPLAIASITTVAAFLPLFLVDGTEGQYGFSLGAVVALMLLGSFLAALALLPTLAVWMLADARPDGQDNTDAWASRRGPFERLGALYARAIGWCVRGPLVVLAVCLALVVLGAYRFGGVSQQLFPLSERAQFLVYVDLAKGSDIAATAALSRRFVDWLGNDEINPEITGTTLFVGFGGPRFVLTLDPADTDPSSAFAIVDTVDHAGSVDAMSRAEVHALAAYPEARFRFKRLAMGGREPGIDVEIAGPDADRLLAAAYAVEARIAEAPGIVQNRNDWGAKRLTGQVLVAQDRAREYGLTSRTVSEALEGFLDGRQVSTLLEGNRQIPIVLRGEAGYRDSFEDLANIAIEANGQLLGLDQVAELEPNLEFSTLRRLDQRRTVTVGAISREWSAYELADHVEPTLERLRAELGPAYTLHIGGEVEQAGDVRGKLGAGVPIAVTVMLLALMAQFDSFRRVAITLATVPLVIVGVPLALGLTDKPLSFFGTLGLIALAGIVINNAIVLIDQIDRERENLPLDEAIVAAAAKRFRPILLTSLTTVLGLAPMAIAGGALWEPMATLMIGGLGVASVLTLFYVPALYRLLFAWKASGATEQWPRTAAGA